MATILLVWELGAGTGHATHSAPIVNALAEGGHRVVASLRDPSVARGLFDPGVTLLPGAFRCEQRIGPKRITNTFADLLADAASFDDADALAAVATAWRNLLLLVKPDLVLFDHAPTVLLASRGLGCRRIVFGPGFNCPPDVSPLPSLRPWANLDPEQLEGTEAPLLACVNRVLESWGEEPIGRLGQLYGEVDDTLLITFPELDCYREHRTDGPWYFGPVLGGCGGVAPQWPAGAGPRVYAYVRPFEHLPALMKLVGERDLPTLIYAPSPGLAGQLRRDFARPTLRIETRALDLSLVAEACDVAVSHGGHGMVCSLLLNGLPALHVPLHTEMGLNARAVRLLGAGLDAPADDPAKLAERFGAIVAAPERYRHAALQFAARHSDFDAAGQQDAMLARIEETLVAASLPA